MILATGTGASGPATDDSRPFRLAFSVSMFKDVNEADIRAAMKVWIMTIVKDLDMAVDPDPNIQPTVAAMAEFGLTHQVDGFALTTPELAHLSRKMPFDRIAIGTTDGQLGDKYLLIVQRDSGIDRLEQLKGLDINVLDHPRMSLAMIWLETRLLTAQLGSTEDFFSHVNLNTNATRVVLPVFFKSIAACLVSRAVFDVMAELNPQLGATATHSGRISLPRADRIRLPGRYRFPVKAPNSRRSEAGGETSCRSPAAHPCSIRCNG